MKVQLQAQSLRVRIDEAELARLLAGESLELRLQAGQQALFAIQLRLAAALDLQPGLLWQLHLPEPAVRDYAATLPRRDALVFCLASAEGPDLRVDFEVDVRDSLQQRGHKGARGR